MNDLRGTTFGDSFPRLSHGALAIHPAVPAAMPRPSRCTGEVTLAILLLLIAACTAGCAGPYRAGNDTLYPADVRTVYVPMFESDSFRRHLGERLTEAVVKRIETDSPFKVVNNPNADSVLTGRIVFDTKRTIVENIFDDPRDTEYNMQVLVTWVSRHGQVLAEQSVALPPAAIDIGARSDIIPEFGRSVTSQQQAVIDNIANQIVGLMEMPW
jgi:hypothetical protein